MIETSPSWHAPITMFRKRPVHLLALLLLGCTNKELGSEDDETETETGTETGTDSAEGDGDTDELGDDADDESDDATDEATTGNTSNEDCELGEYIPNPFTPNIDWTTASGYVVHGSNRGVSGIVDPEHYVSALFLVGADVDDSLLCVEWLVGDADVGIDECNVHYTQGFGLGGEQWPGDAAEDLVADAVTFDVGDGPVPLDAYPNQPGNPIFHGGSFPPPPDGVPYGGSATLAVNFSDLPDLDVELDVPADLMPITPAFESTMLADDALASWTWSNSGGSEPLVLEIDIADSPWGSGWSERVRIQCTIADDGEFEFPVEYFDLARERLGSEIYAGATLVRSARGQVPLAGENFHWQSGNEVRLAVAIVD